MIQDTFSDIYHSNHWKNDESVSGNGSTMDATAEIRSKLPGLFRNYFIKSVLDIPCGDYNWFKEMKLEIDYYLGADIVPEIVEANQQYADFNRAFHLIDATSDDLPRVDLILCRDMLGHFSNADVKRTLQNFRASGSRYLLATTFPNHENSTNIETGQWRPINLASLFGLPNPIELINEKCMEGGGKFMDKSLGLWRLN